MMKLIKMGIYPLLLDGTIITEENVKKGDYLPFIDIETIQNYYPFVSRHSLSSRTLFDEEMNQKNTKDYNHLLTVITETFFYRFGFKPTDPFNVDLSMFIFPGGFLSTVWGCCGNWRPYQMLFNRWLYNHWSPYPLKSSNEKALEIIEKSIKNFIYLNRKANVFMYVKAQLLAAGIYLEVKNGFRRFPYLDTEEYSWIVIKGENYDIDAIYKNNHGDFSYKIATLCSIEEILKEMDLNLKLEKLEISNSEAAALKAEREAAALKAEREAAALKAEREAAALKAEREAAVLKVEREAAALKVEREAAALKVERETQRIRFSPLLNVISPRPHKIYDISQIEMLYPFYNPYNRIMVPNLNYGYMVPSFSHPIILPNAYAGVNISGNE